MATIVGIVFPIFALIGLGYLGRRLGLLSGDAAAALSGYVYYFSLPALLYVKVAEVPVAEFFSGNLIFAYSGGILTASLLIWAVGRLRGMDRRTIGMFILNATFGNVGYMGVPFNTVAFGEQGMPVVALTIVLTSVITILLSMTLGLAVMEGGGSNVGGWRGLIPNLFPGWFLSNPVLLSIAVGVLASLLAIRLPEPVQRFLGLLADTAGPVALFAIGTFLHGTPVLKGLRGVTVLAGLKLVALPLPVYPLGPAAVPHVRRAGLAPPQTSPTSSAVELHGPLLIIDIDGNGLHMRDHASLPFGWAGSA